MANKLKHIILMLCASAGLKAQNISLLPKKGKIMINNQTCRIGVISVLKPTDIVTVGPNALVLVKDNKGAVKQLSSGHKYTYKGILKLFPKKTSFNKAFLDVVFTSESQKQKSGGVSRGTTDSFISPPDGFRILSDSILINIDLSGRANKLLSGNIRIYPAMRASDSIVIIGSLVPVFIVCPEPGDYIWTYQTIHTSGKMKRIHRFSVLDIATKEYELKKWKDFNISISSFSPEMQILLSNEYLLENQLYFK